MDTLFANCMREGGREDVSNVHVSMCTAKLSQQCEPCQHVQCQHVQIFRGCGRQNDIFCQNVSHVKFQQWSQCYQCMSNHVHVHQYFWLKYFRSCKMPGKDHVSMVSKILRGHCPEGGPASATYVQANPELIIEKLEPIIKELVMLKEVKKTGKFLQECAQTAFPRMAPAECLSF